MRFVKASDLFFCLVLVTALLASSSAYAQNEPPDEVFDAVRQELEAGGSEARYPFKLFQPVKIGSKETQWRVDFEKSGSADWCGSGGCRVMLFAQHDKTWQAVFDRQVRSVRFKGDELFVEIYGKFCGKAGNAPCMARYRWNARQRIWQAQDMALLPLEQ